MIRSMALAAAAAGFSLMGSATATFAQGVGLQHPASAYYRSGGARNRVVRGPQVRGFAQRRVGGYSYFKSDTINTYGDSRTTYGGTNVFRDGLQDRQTRFGPFDHGFFFDSGIGPRGGYSPYHN